MTLVVLHQTDPEAEGDPGFDVYVHEKPPVRVTSLAEANTLLDQLGVTDAELVGAAACARCCHIAPAAVLTADADSYRFALACDDHRETIPPGGYPITGTVMFRATYDRRSPAHVAELARKLIGHDVPPEIWQQPECAHCHARLRPGPFPRLIWEASDGKTGCSRRKRHTIAPGEPAATIARYAQQVAEWIEAGSFTPAAGAQPAA